MHKHSLLCYEKITTRSDLSKSKLTVISDHIFLYKAMCCNKCENGGLTIVNVEGVCGCKCPSGLKGDDCSQLDTSHCTYTYFTSFSCTIDIIIEIIGHS